MDLSYLLLCLPNIQPRAGYIAEAQCLPFERNISDILLYLLKHTASIAGFWILLVKVLHLSSAKVTLKRGCGLFISPCFLFYIDYTLSDFGFFRK